MKKAFTLIFSLFFCCLFVFPVAANILPDTDWQTIKTEHFLVFYQRDYEAIAIEALTLLEYYRPQLEAVFRNELKELAVLIEDTGIANGFADPVNYRMSLFYNNPQITSELSGESWLSLVAVHEYVHMLSLSKTGGDVQILQNLFGNLFLPNALINGWLSEGIAVYHESMLSPYSGRLNEGFYDAYIGTLVAEDKLPSIVDASFFPARYPNGAMYLYGAQFFDFLAKEYGEEKLGELFSEHGSSPLSFLTFLVPGIGIDRSAKQVFYKTLPELWDEWHVCEKKRFADFKIEGERLTNHGWNASLTQSLDGEIYYYRSYPLEAGDSSYFQKEIVSYNPETAEINVVIGRRDLANMFTITKDYLYYVTDISVHGYANTSNNGFGTEKVLWRVNRQSGAAEVLFKGPLRSFLPLADGVILYTKARLKKFGSELWLYSTVTQEQKLLCSLDYLVHSMLIYEDTIIAVAGEENRNSNIYQFSLATAEFTELIGSPFSESQISLSEISFSLLQIMIMFIVFIVMISRMVLHID